MGTLGPPLEEDEEEHYWATIRVGRRGPPLEWKKTLLGHYYVEKERGTPGPPLEGERREALLGHH